MNEYLPVATLLRLLAVLLLTLAPHALHQPLWLSAGVVAVIGWRGLAAWRSWRMPPRALRWALVIVAFAAVYADYGRVSGLTAGTALLCVMAALKLIELRARRDVLVVVGLMYFAVLTHFLYSQQPWTAIYLLATVTAITALLIECQHQGALPPRQMLRKAGVLIAQSLPLMLILFVLFPRLPGPLWGLPSDTGAGARSGLSESMAPGDIAALIQSDELAFRVRFLDAVPPPAQRYWRGPVFDSFDGRSWRRLGAAPPLAAGMLEPRGTPLRYELTLEPQRLRTLITLEMPGGTLPGDAQLDRDAQLVARRTPFERRRDLLGAYPQYVLEPTLDARRRQWLRLLPRERNPRTLALARQWREQAGDDDAAIVTRALRMFREQDFHYTLQPPLLGRDSVDEFLFDSRRGFCEHYSSAFTVLMRAAGIPARIVTGYQGGSYNQIGGHYTVSQADAHAWSEVWLPGRGWLRVDPTAAVSPERVERGLSAALGAGDGLPAYLARRGAWQAAIKLRWDWLNARWNGLVLGYGPELQQDLLRRFGIDDLRAMILALTLVFSAAVALIGMILLRRARPAPARDAALRSWQRLLRKLARRGLQPRPGEGPRDFIERVAARWPARTDELRRIASLYLRNRYLGDADAAVLRELDNAIAALRL